MIKMLKIKTIYRFDVPILKYFDDSKHKFTTPIDELNEYCRLESRLFSRGTNSLRKGNTTIMICANYFKIVNQNNSSKFIISYSDYKDGLAKQIIDMLNSNTIVNNFYRVEYYPSNLNIELRIGLSNTVKEINITVKTDRIKHILISPSPIKIDLSDWTKSLNLIANTCYNVYMETELCDIEYSKIYKYQYSYSNKTGYYYKNKVYKNWEGVINSVFNNMPMPID